MSRIHIAFIKQKSAENSIVYRVESSDFGTNIFIGEIFIDPIKHGYQFIPMGVLEGKAVIPPHVFELPEIEQDAVIKREYPGAGYGGWTSRIARMVSRLQEEGKFPDEFFGVT